MLKSSLAGNRAPEFSQIQGWLNTQPLTLEGLKGKVVLLEFWTFDCVNCIRTLPWEYPGAAFRLNLDSFTKKTLERYLQRT